MEIFADYMLKHGETMQAHGVDIEKMIEIRRDFHKYAEIAFKEFRT